MNNTKILNLLCQNGLLEIYAQENDSKFDVGNLLDFDDEWLLIECFDNFGKFDGYMLIRRENVFKINYQTKYTKDLAKIIQIPTKPLQMVKSHTDLLHKVLTTLLNKGIVSVTLSNSNVIIGEILSIDDLLVSIQVFLDNGIEDGISLFSLDMVSSIQFETRECEAVQQNRFLIAKEP